MQAETLRKNFYYEVEEIRSLTSEEVENCRRLGGVEVAGDNVPKPITSWKHCNVGLRLLETLRKRQYVDPTPLQATVLSVLMRGRDALIIAGSGAGSILSMVLPAGKHVAWQVERAAGSGPIAIFLTATAERVGKICTEINKLHGFSIAAAYPGQILNMSDLGNKVQALICTPCMLPSILTQDTANIQRFTYIVIDCADALLSKGYEKEVRALANILNPQRQLSLFATQKTDAVSELAKELLKSPVTIYAGKPTLMHGNVEHTAAILPAGVDKQQILTDKVTELYSTSRVIIFTNDDSLCDSIHRRLKEVGLPSLAIYEAFDADTTESRAMEFFEEICPVVVANGSVARSLHNKGSAWVINYDAPQSQEQYIDRATCAGRAAKRSAVFKFLAEDDGSLAADMCSALEESGVDVPANIKAVADAHDTKMIKHSVGIKEPIRTAIDAQQSSEERLHLKVDAPLQAPASSCAPAPAAMVMPQDAGSERDHSDVPTSTPAAQPVLVIQAPAEEAPAQGPCKTTAAAETGSTPTNTALVVNHGKEQFAAVEAGVHKKSAATPDNFASTGENPAKVPGSQSEQPIIHLRAFATSCPATGAGSTPSKQGMSAMAAEMTPHAKAKMDKEKGHWPAEAAIGANTLGTTAKTPTTKVGGTRWGPFHQPPAPVCNNDVPNAPGAESDHHTESIPDLALGLDSANRHQSQAAATQSKAY